MACSVRPPSRTLLGKGGIWYVGLLAIHSHTDYLGVLYHLNNAVCAAMTTSSLSDAEIADGKTLLEALLARDQDLCPLNARFVLRLIAEIEAARKAPPSAPPPREGEIEAMIMDILQGELSATNGGSIFGELNAARAIIVALRRLTQPQNAAAGENGK